MLSRQRDANGDDEDSRPLLDDRNGHAHSAEDDEFPVYATPPPLALKSTIASREAGWFVLILAVLLYIHLKSMT
jgi:hypothetical protein